MNDTALQASVDLIEDALQSPKLPLVPFHLFHDGNVLKQLRNSTHLLR